LKQFAYVGQSPPAPVSRQGFARKSLQSGSLVSFVNCFVGLTPVGGWADCGLKHRLYRDITTPHELWQSSNRRIVKPAHCQTGALSGRRGGANAGAGVFGKSGLSGAMYRSKLRIRFVLSDS
jgi:hypothetical protein